MAPRCNPHSAPCVPTPEPLTQTGLNSTASITASSMTLTHEDALDFDFRVFVSEVAIPRHVDFNASSV